MKLDWSHVKLQPFAHQIEDVEFMLRQPWVFNTSEMRTGKTKTEIDAAQFKFQQGLIDRVVIVCPQPVRDVWFQPEFGEIWKHAWDNINHHVTEYHSVMRRWSRGPSKLPFNHKDWHGLKWIVTNFEFIRSEQHLAKLLPYLGPKTQLVLDESSAVKHHKSKQTLACMRLRYIHRRKKIRGEERWINTWEPRVGRCTLINGTPEDTPEDLFSQGNMIHPNILGCKYISNFKATYAIMGGYMAEDSHGRKIPTQVLQWVRLDELSQRFAPHVIRRLQKDCLDLPPKLDPVVMPVRLDKPTWNIYKKMRDELVVSFDRGEFSSAPHAITKVMRLAQITSGYIGGVESLLEEGDDVFGDADALPDWIDAAEPTVKLEVPKGPVQPVREISREKLDALLWFYDSRLNASKNFKMVAWCRFRPEMDRVANEIAGLYPGTIVATIAGGQKRAERLASFKLLHPDTSPDQPVFVVGTFGTGAKGLNFTAAHTSMNISYNYSYETFAQSADRVYGPGQTHPVAYYDLVAEGPDGQQTIDHVIIRARLNKEAISKLTIDQWITRLKNIS